jgi:hypothetical protein
MSRTRQHFRQSDLVKALKAMTKAGVQGRVEIAPDGRMIIIAGKPGSEQNSGADDLDRELAEFEAHHGTG